jgi:diadenosine tetraphosphatase ApaH/serine/threonine PP2A family protein phosphatase
VAVEWTAARISPQTRAWLTDLPMFDTEEPLTLVHASPRDPDWEYVLSPGIARANLDQLATRHCLVGHTHVPLVFRRRGTAIEALHPDHGTKMAIDGQRLIANPGSVGQPRDGDPRASALIYDTDGHTLEWHRVAYPIERVQALMADLELPVRLIARLRFGL